MESRNADVDLVQTAAVLMALKVILPYSRIIPFAPLFDNAFLLLSLFLMASQFWIRRLDRRNLVAGVLLCLLAAYTGMVSDDSSILITVLTLFVLSNYPEERFIRAVFFAELCLLLFHVVYSLGYSVLADASRFVMISGGRERFTFGFVHPNTFGTLAASVMLMYLWLSGDRNLWLKLCVCVGLQLVLFGFTDSRTSLLAGLLSLAMLAVVKWKNPEGLVRWALRLAVPVLAAFMILMMKLYTAGHPVALLFDRVFNSRVKLGAYAYAKLGLSMLGQPVPFYTNMKWEPAWGLTSFNFDNIYSYLLVQGGIVWLALLGVAFWRFSKKAAARDGVFLLAWAIYGMCENTGLNGYMLFPVFLLARTLTGRQRKKFPIVEEVNGQ